jgi:predicted ATPase
MSLLRLEVQGFKSLKELSWEPGALNVIIGPNGSGKSNLLQVLELLRAASFGKLSDFVQQQGGIDALLWDGRAKTIQFRMETGPSGKTTEAAPLQYSLVMEQAGQWSSFRIISETLQSQSLHPLGATNIEIARKKQSASILDTRSEQMLQLDEGISEEEALLSIGTAPMVNVAMFVLHRDVSKWSIHGAINTARSATIRQPVLTRREMTVDGDGENLIAVLHTLYSEHRGFRSELNTAMRAAFDNNFEELIFPPASDQRVQLRVNWKHLKRSQPSAMLSDGTLRFLYLMAILANPEPPALIAIEEPEVGLHPSMFPIIAEYAVQASKRTQVIFTTHSADFLDAFRDTGVAPTTTVTQWRDGATTLKVLEGEELAYWLREYTLGQLFRSSELEQIG